MSHSPEQNRKKAEAMADAHHHNLHGTVDGERARDHSSHMAHMPGPTEIGAERHRQDIYDNKSLRQKAYDVVEAIAGVPSSQRGHHYEGIAKENE